MKTTPTHALVDQLNYLTQLVDVLRSCKNDFEKLDVLNKVPCVQDFINDSPHLQAFLAGLTPACDLAIKSILAIGQGPFVFQQMGSIESPYEKVREMLDILLPAEKFYQELGGLVGYHTTVLRLIAEKQGLISCKKDQERYSKPAGLDLTQEDSSVYLALREGIESFAQLAEIYPVGGAGDRLQLRDEHTGELLPVAQMELCGKTLLEWLIQDLQAREYLYYKLTGKQTVTPIAMMTSHEKRNNERIIKICEDKKWFGRPRQSIRFFIQPLVPMISEEGNWCLSAPLKLMFKPGGHGVMWKLAQDAGIFSWFAENQRKKALVRQINNPIAGIDIGLLAFTGQGFLHNKAFGFASCFRALNAAEGMNVLAEKQAENGFECCITNVEYTDFAQRGISDTPESPGSSYSAFPANTNILFADLDVIEKTILDCPIPGTILNMKNAVECLDSQGKMQQVKAGRLESTMQNIADFITDYFPEEITPAQQAELKTFVTYNHRHRTISVTKKSYTPGQPLLETPEGCYYDLQRHAYELLNQHCGMQTPCLPDPLAFTNQGPAFLVHLHPALGPAYHVIGQKIRGGNLHQGAELTIEASEIDLVNLALEGSLLIHAMNPLGGNDSHGHTIYSDESGKCTLTNVAVKNKGINWSTPQPWWKGRIQREEALEIVLHGNAEFHAENVTFNGPFRIEVPNGHRVEAIPYEGTFELVTTKISQPSWFWKYAFSQNNRIILTKRTIHSH